MIRFGRKQCFRPILAFFEHFSVIGKRPFTSSKPNPFINLEAIVNWHVSDNFNTLVCVGGTINDLDCIEIDFSPFSKIIKTNV